MEIVVYERDQDISYSGCGLPYFVGGQVLDAAELHPRDPAWFADRFGMGIRIRHEMSHLPGAVLMPLKDLRRRAGELDASLPTVTYCNSGVSGNAGQNVLLALGFSEVSNLSGGNSNYQTHLRELRAHQPTLNTGPVGA